LPPCILDSKVDMFEHSEYGCVEVTSWKEREEKKGESKRKKNKNKKKEEYKRIVRIGDQGGTTWSIYYYSREREFSFFSLTRTSTTTRPKDQISTFSLYFCDSELFNTSGAMKHGVPVIVLPIFADADSGPL